MGWRALVEKIKAGEEVVPGVSPALTGKTSINQSEDFRGLQQSGLVDPVSPVSPVFRGTRISCFSKTTTFNTHKRQGYTSNDDNNRHSLVSLPRKPFPIALVGCLFSTPLRSVQNGLVKLLLQGRFICRAFTVEFCQYLPLA